MIDPDIALRGGDGRDDPKPWLYYDPGFDSPAETKPAEEKIPAHYIDGGFGKRYRYDWKTISSGI